MENKIKVTNLYIYPIKSCHEIELTNSVVTQHGLLNDRVLTIIDKNTLEFLSIRSNPEMYFITVEIDKDNSNLFTISIPNQNKFTIDISTQIHKLNPDQIFNIKIWSLRGDVTIVETENDMLNKSLSEYLKREVLLVKPITERKMEDYTTRHKLTDLVKDTDKTYFADLAPLLITSQESFDYINRLMEEKGENGLEMLNFRPNIVLQGGPKEFWENDLRKIKIGNVIYRRIKGCDRCKITTFDIKERKFRNSKEPLETLNDVSYDDVIEGVIFGQNFCLDLSDDNSENFIKVGDDVYILD